MLYLLVFGLVFLGNALAVRDIQAVQRGRAHASGFYSAAMYGLNGAGLLAAVSNPWALVAGAAGAYAGSWWATATGDSGGGRA